MTFPDTRHDQSHFDSLCAEVEDYERLPEVLPGPFDVTPYLSDDEQTDSIDAEILAGLVSP
jgi:hypothetical protein